MSIALREVFKEFNSVTYGKSSFNRDERILESNDKLLLSNDNLRSNPRSKTSINIHDFHEVLPCNNKEWRLRCASSASSATITSHHTDALKNHLEATSSFSSKEIRNDLNRNAQDNTESVHESLKKGKRSRKRNSSNVKSKKGKHGRLLTAATGVHEKQSSVQQILPNTQHVKPSRVSSEPPSKVSQASVLSYTLQDSGNGLSQQHVYNVPFSNKNVHDMYPLRVASAKTNSNILPSTHCLHGNLTCYPAANNIHTASYLESSGKPVVIYKLEMNPRVKSASSLKLDETNKPVKQKEETEGATTNMDEISVSAVSCNLQVSNKSNTMKLQQKNLYSSHGLSTDLVSKEAVLTSIYGAVYHTADKVSAQAEELKKVKKIFLSEKQSGTIRESGMDFPCAPPATPTPDLLRKHEYVPCMSDIRSQRAVKNRLQMMEKEALKKQEKRKEANARLEKQQQKDKEKQLKAKQRKEIYALNKIMTELENKRFVDFCQAKGLNKT